jgi:tetratricopeptide (TPR) repeat protein
MGFSHFPRITAALALAAMLFAAVGCQDDEAKLADFLARGQVALDAEEYEEAVIEYRNALQIDPNNGAAHFALARSYTALQKLKEAYWELHETVRLDPENIDARVSFAQFSQLARDYEEVLIQCEEILAIQPERASAFTLRGEAYSALERYDEAEAAFESAIENSLEENRSLHLENMVRFQNRRGNYAGARPYLDRQIELAPSMRAYASLGRLLTRDGEIEAAEAAMKMSLSLAKSQKDIAYRNLAGFYFNLDRIDDAIETLQQGIDNVEKGRLDLIYLLARFHSSQGNSEAADLMVAQATLEAPDDPEPWLVLSSYRTREGDSAGALEAVEKAIAVAPEDTVALLRKAELLAENGYRGKSDEDISSAKEIVIEILSREPSNARALFVRGKIEMAELDPRAAAQTLRSALDVEPEFAPARFVLGSALMLIGDQNGARAELARTIELDPGLLEARRSLSRIHGALGEHEYAIEQGRMYLRERPEDVRTRILVAQSLVHLGKAEEAFAELEVIPDESRDADSWYAMGRLFMAQGKAEEAREALLEANAQRPNMPDILRSLLRVEAPAGKFGAAADRVRAAVKAQPENARLALLEGRIELIEGNADAAEAAFQRSVELDPDDATAYQQLAQFYRMTGRLEESIATHEKSIEQNPNSARSHERLAMLHEASGDVDKATEYYERAIALDSSLGEAKNNLAYLLAERGDDLDRALDLAQEAKALLPDSPNAADTLGWVLYKRGIPSAAIGYLREAISGFAGEGNEEALGVVRHHLAMAYEANEQDTEALQALDAAIASADRIEESGGKPGWADEVREMAQRLRSPRS